MKKIKIYNIMKYLISYANINGITNAKYKTWQQKFLWFLNFYYTKENGDQLFTKDFYAFNYGPVSRTILEFQYFDDEEVYFYKDVEEVADLDVDEQGNLVKRTTIKKIATEQELKEKFIQEFTDNNENLWNHFKKIFKKCEVLNSGKLVFLSHTQFLWKNKIELSGEEKKILLNDILEEETDPLDIYDRK
ncbi:type II toxin-antitoxin system antitoxin SocA domain-containing protein [Mycoplasma procyoni]|uniref:type II toxin-antitoxin system antitoxin SocA domain-containing protein n=1 Tax=Mycoplasma procyoni TaxID=568784 RepID=UPI00197B3FD6|nr:type II toxin-antitoxin system antitoxin SocA domain-containing protein [Mycoplasma procyoni]MBN3535141.1 DUF4065 domain-containing protein [Mycoplasma procyoni]